MCADAGYTGAHALEIIEKHGYIPDVKGGGMKPTSSSVNPKKKARRMDKFQVLRLVLDSALMVVRSTRVPTEERFMRL